MQKKYRTYSNSIISMHFMFDQFACQVEFGTKSTNVHVRRIQILSEKDEQLTH